MSTTTPSSSAFQIPTLALTPKTSSYILPVVILIGIVIASAAQTEFAHHVSTVLGYDRPYFTFYLTHTTFSLIFPLHLLVLKFTSNVDTSTYLDSIRHLLSNQLELGHDATWKQVAPAWSRKVSWLTLFLSVPSISWYIAMGLSPPVDITAIYATSSFATYGASMVLIGTPLSRVTVASIALAFVGVVVISMDGLKGEIVDVGGRVLGDAVMLFGAIVLGLYEVIYKLALPEGHGGVPSVSPSKDYAPLPTHHSPPSSPPSPSIGRDRQTRSSHPQRNPSHRSHYAHPPTDSTPTPIELTPPLSRTTSHAVLLPTKGQIVPLPPALHANFLTSCIGVATFLLLWPPIILLDWLGYESFQWPGTVDIWLNLGVVTWGGSLYNAGLMVLIGIWGPTTSSVANLLTIGLVALVDSVWLAQMPDLQTVLGVAMICVGFGVILWEGEE
ncbi:hypothetical protein IAU60_005224 [Kwoniella sp. DSM 27419]